MSRPSGRGAGALVVPLLLIALGAVCWALSRIGTSGSGHVYAGGGTPPARVQLTLDHTYFLATPGGVPVLDRRGLDASRVSCTATDVVGVRSRLVLQAEAGDTKAINEFATFAAPGTGSFAVACTGVREVFVDDADSAPADRSGLLLAAGVAALTLGLALLLSALRSRSRSTAQASPG